VYFANILKLSRTLCLFLHLQSCGLTIGLFNEIASTSGITYCLMALWQDLEWWTGKALERADRNFFQWIFAVFSYTGQGKQQNNLSVGTQIVARQKFETTTSRTLTYQFPNNETNQLHKIQTFSIYMREGKVPMWELNSKLPFSNYQQIISLD